MQQFNNADHIGTVIINQYVDGKFIVTSHPLYVQYAPRSPEAYFYCPAMFAVVDGVERSVYDIATSYPGYDLEFTDPDFNINRYSKE